MPLITETYYLSLTQDNRGILRLRCSQDDTLRTVNLKLYNNGSIFAIPSGISASVSGVKQNGAVFSKPCTISQDRESVVLQLSSDITNVDGIIIAEIVLSDGNGGRLGTSNFIIQVEKNPIRAGVIQDTETPIEYINDFITQIQALTARLNNLITPSGDPSLAEVVDARISSLDNNTYPNIKARIDADIATLNTGKADKADVYTKPQVDDLLEDVEIDVDDELSDESENPVQNKVINRAISEIKADLGAQTGLFHWNEKGFIDLSGNTVNLTPETNSGIDNTVIECRAGDKFIITARGGNKSRVWGFIDSNNSILSVSDANAEVENFEITAPANAVKLILNAYRNFDIYAYKVGNNLASAVYKNKGLSPEIANVLLSYFYHMYSDDEYGMQYYNRLKNLFGSIKYHWTSADSDVALINGLFDGIARDDKQYGKYTENNKRAVFCATRGEIPFFNSDGITLSEYYPILIPEDAKNITVTKTDSSFDMSIVFRKYTGEGNEMQYVLASGWENDNIVTMNIPVHDTRGRANILWVHLRKTNNSQIDEMPSVDILFE